jgi:predicted O-methyltransferase YrrM
MLKRLFSFFLPVNIHSQKSSISNKIEITWANGQLVLDSRNTNYSYGSLQRILRLGLRSIGYERVFAMGDILVLGVAGGSVIKTLVDEIGCKGNITGVEIDAEIIEVANKYFGLDRIPNLQIVIDDAFEYVLKTKQQYNLIIIDVFQDTVMPNFLFESFFANRLAILLKENGLILFNTMTLNGIHDARNEEYISHFARNEFAVRTIPRVENHNELIVIEKISG